MKYCVNSKTKSLLDKADEILVQWRDRIDILDLAYKYKKDIVLDVPFETELIESELAKLKSEAAGHLILRVNSLSHGTIAKALDIPFYFDTYLKTMIEVEGVKELGVCYIQLDTALFHRINVVRLQGIPIRINPTVSKHDIFDLSDGVRGSYVRPEDIDLYEDCTIEFGDNDEAREATLYKLYNAKSWAGPLVFLATDVQSNAVNRLIVEDFGVRRANCDMSCKVNGVCHLCETALTLASMKEKLEEYKQEVL